jgi:simple sugar transport system permease protein
MEITLSSFVAAIAVMAAPLILAALGETLTEKAGVVNLSLDGTLLLAAMTGFVVASRSQSLTLGFLAAALTGCGVAALLAIIGVWESALPTMTFIESSGLPSSYIHSRALAASTRM